MQALKKVGRKGKREERETHSFLISLLDFLPPSPPFFLRLPPRLPKMARPRGQSTGTPTSLYDCRNYNHGIGDVSQA